MIRESNYSLTLAAYNSESMNVYYRVESIEAYCNEVSVSREVVVSVREMENH